MNLPRFACLAFPDGSSPAAIRALAEACYRFSPQIGLIESHAIWIEIGRSRKLFSEEAFRKRALALAGRFGLQPRLKIRSHALMAWALARSGAETEEALPMEILLLFADPLGRDPRAAKSVQKLIHSLDTVGIRSLSEFLALPANQLSSRFGAIALLARHRLTGELDLAWPHWQPDPEVREKRILQYEEQTSHLESLLYLLRPALDRMFSRLWARGRRLSQIEIQLKLETRLAQGRETRSILIELLLPQSTSRGFLPILDEKLRRQFERRPLSGDVIEIDLRVTGHVPGYEAQRNFLSDSEEKNEAWSTVLSQIAEAIGNRGKVFRAHLKAERLPEKSWDRGTLENQPAPTFDLQRILPPRPARMLRRPERVELTAQQVHIRKKSHRIRSWSRPEILTEWRGASVQRKYYRIDIEDAPPLWVFADERDDFYLHGYFE